MRIASILNFIITFFWSFANVIYSRFFFHYLSLSAIEQGNVLTEKLVIRCIIESLQIVDLFYLIVALLFIYAICEKRPSNKKKLLKNLIIIFCLSIILDLSAHAAYCFYNPQLRYASYYLHRLYLQHFASPRRWSQQNLVHFVRGEIRTTYGDLLTNLQGTIDLTDRQLVEIQTASIKAQNSLSNNILLPTSKNVIFIIVESYMSFTSDMAIEGKEITPFLNSLKHGLNTYYNGEMRENVTLGESSDGQFIYMTGILPLQSDVTVSKARKNVLPGLPKILGRESRMIIPTTTAVWNQDEMCRQYGFDYLYTRNDYSNYNGADLNDEQVFELAIQKDKTSPSPFFSVILTMSMHGPFINLPDKSFKISDTSLPNDLICYLNACHYTDHQIELYFEHLKNSDLYDSSLIVIAADHHVHKADFGEIDKHIPLYIVNNSGLPENMWQGECNQLDVYTTLLDLLGCGNDWYGLGRSLVSPNYRNVLSPHIQDVSEWIILGDYFYKHKN